MKNAMGGRTIRYKIYHIQISWRAERLKREEKIALTQITAHFFFLNLPKRNGADHLIFPPELSVPKEMTSTPWERTPWESGENPLEEQEPITNSTHIWFVAYRIRTQATLTAMLATNIDFAFYVTPYCPCITFFCSNKSNVLPQVTLFSCVNEYTVFLMRKQAAQRLIIFATHAAS